MLKMGCILLKTLTEMLKTLIFSILLLFLANFTTYNKIPVGYIIKTSLIIPYENPKNRFVKYTMFPSIPCILKYSIWYILPFSISFHFLIP